MLSIMTSEAFAKPTVAGKGARLFYLHIYIYIDIYIYVYMYTDHGFFVGLQKKMQPSIAVSQKQNKNLRDFKVPNFHTVLTCLH